MVEDVRENNERASNFKVIQGALWSRATALLKLVTGVVKPRQIVNMQTPTTTIGIRGTDWYVEVDQNTGASRVVLLTGEARVYNEFGEVTVNSGEEAQVEPGKAPVKRVIVDIKDIPLFALEYSPKWFDFFHLSDLSYREMLTRKQSGLENLDTIEQILLLHDLGELDAVQRRLEALGEVSNMYLVLLRGLLAARAGEYNRAEVFFSKAIDAPEQRIQRLTQLARVASLMTQKEYAAAQTLLSSIQDESVSDVVLFKSIMAFQSGDYAQTFKIVEQGIEQFPETCVSKSCLPMPVYSQVKLKKCLQHCSAYWKLIGSCSGLASTGHLLFKYSTRCRTGIDSISRVLEINPDLYTSRNNLALLYWDLGDYRKSLRQMALASESGPEESLILANQGFQAANLEYLNEADEFYRRALKQDPSQPVAISGEAYLALGRGDNDLAIEKFLQLIAINPNQPGAHTSLAIAYYQAGAACCSPGYD